MSDDNPATDPEVKPPPQPEPKPEPKPDPAPQPTTPQAEIPVVVEEQKPESWIEKHRKELELFYDERESKRTAKTETRPAREGKKDSGDDASPDPEPTAPKPKRKRVKLRSLKKRS